MVLEMAIFFPIECFLNNRNRSGTIMYSSTVVHLIRNRPIDIPKCTEIKHYLLCRFVA